MENINLNNFLSQSIITPKNGGVAKVYHTGKTSYVKLLLEDGKIYIATEKDQNEDYIAILTLGKIPNRPLIPEDHIEVTKVNYNSAQGIFI